MFPLAHAAGTLLAWRLKGDRWGPLPVPLWAGVVVAAGLPDLVDKPLGLLVLGTGTGRLLGHSLVFVAALAVTAALLRAGGRVRAGGGVGLLAFGSGVHLVLDRMHHAPRVLLWPLLGTSFPTGDFDPATWRELLLGDPWTYGPEVLGAAYLAWEGLNWVAARRRASP